MSTKAWRDKRLFYAASRPASFTESHKGKGNMRDNNKGVKGGVKGNNQRGHGRLIKKGKIRIVTTGMLRLG